MRIVVIGTGRLASNLVPALQKVGHEVRVVNSRTLEGLPNEAEYRSPLWCFLSHAKLFKGTTSGFC